MTPFEAFCGVRPIDETVAMLDEIGLSRLGEAYESSGVAETIDALLRRKLNIAPIIEACAADDRPEAQVGHPTRRAVSRTTRASS